jgi:predicted enzyme related to lactoylglutathione lyase
MITAFHSLVYADDPEAARAFFRDVLRWPYVDTGGGWLIFKTGPSELGVHPTVEGEWSTEQKHEISLMCDDIEKTVAELRDRGAQFSGEVADLDFGLAIQTPGSGRSPGHAVPAAVRPAGPHALTRPWPLDGLLVHLSRTTCFCPSTRFVTTGRSLPGRRRSCRSGELGEVLEGQLFECHHPSITHKFASATVCTT